MEKVYGFYIIVLPESYFSPLRRLTSLPSIDLLRPSRIYLKLINIFLSRSLSALALTGALKRAAKKSSATFH